MLPLVDARSGQVINGADLVKNSPDKEDWYSVAWVRPGIFSATVALVRWDMELHKVECPIKYFPRLLYGPRFPVDAWRVAIIPS